MHVHDAKPSACVIPLQACRIAGAAAACSSDPLNICSSSLRAPSLCCLACCPSPDADLLPELRAAKAEGLPLSVETCPHYLNFAAEDVPKGDTRCVSR